MPKIEELRKEIKNLELEGKELHILNDERKIVSEFKEALVTEIGD